MCFLPTVKVMRITTIPSTFKIQKVQTPPSAIDAHLPDTNSTNPKCTFQKSATRTNLHLLATCSDPKVTISNQPEPKRTHFTHPHTPRQWYQFLVKLDYGASRNTVPLDPDTNSPSPTLPDPRTNKPEQKRTQTRPPAHPGQACQFLVVYRTGYTRNLVQLDPARSKL